MKKKLLTSAAIASFLTAAGIVIPQADIFAADTPNTPPSTAPSVQPSTEPKPSAEGAGGTTSGPVTNSVGIVEKFIKTISGEVTSDGKLVYTIKSKEPLSGDVVLRIYNDRNGKTDNHLHFNKIDDNTYVGDYSISSLQKGVYKPYELSFTDSTNKAHTLNSFDLIPFQDKSKVAVGETIEEPINSPQLQGKKIGVFANYKKVKRGTVVKYTLKIANDKLKDRDYLLLHKEGQFDHVNSYVNGLYDINGNRIIYVETDRLDPGIYNVLGFDGNGDYKLEDIYNEDGWFEVGNEDIRREGPAVWDTVSTTKPDETPKPTPEPQPEKPSETPKPTPEPQPKKDETTKSEKDNSWNPFAQGQKIKEGSTEVKSEAGEVVAKPVSNRKEGKALPNTGLQTTSYGFLAAIVGLFGAVALRRKNR